MLDASEIEALDLIVRTLDSLPDESRGRIMLYLRGRLDAIASRGSLPASTVDRSDERPNVDGGSRRGKIIDIRQLKVDKSPKSDIEMAALVGYYLQEEAPEGERKRQFDAADLEKYFKQAGHPLPKRLAYTLNNTKNAGYLDVVESGVYRLNPVGYNLVAHALPANGSGKKSARSKKKPVQKKKVPKRAGKAKSVK